MSAWLRILGFVLAGSTAALPSYGDGHLASEKSAPQCAHHTALRQAFYGDLHIHTGISMDAWMFGTRPRPADAYRFARGETLPIAPLDEDEEL